MRERNEEMRGERGNKKGERSFEYEIRNKKEKADKGKK